jgi:SprT protein
MTIEQKFKEVIALAEKLYNIDLSDVVLEPSIKGYRSIGQAGTYPCGTRKFRYSLTHLRNNTEFYLNEIVPHEIAHIVCNATGLGKNHDTGWRRVATRLGCNTPRAKVPLGTFSVSAPKRKSYLYIDSLGNEHNLTGQRHALIQNKGKTYTVTGTGATIDAGAYNE